MVFNADKEVLGETSRKNSLSKEGFHRSDANHKVLSDFVVTRFGRIHIIQTAKYDPQLTPVICLHMSGHSGRSFQELIEKSYGKRRYIAFDYPGYGMSDPPADHYQMTIAEYAEIGWEVADLLGLDSVNLFGHHTGAKVAVEMNSQLSNRIQRIILAAVSLSSESADNTQSLRAEPNGLIAVDILWSLINSFFGESASDKAKQNMLREAIKSGPHLLSAQKAAIAFNEFFPEALSKIKVPVTVLNLNDELRLETPKIMPLIERGELIESTKWGHGFMDDYPEDVFDFLEQIYGQ